MICQQCQTELMEGAKFCSGCGTPVPEPQVSPVCQQCQTELPEGARFCNECGTPVPEPKEALRQTEQRAGEAAEERTALLDRAVEERRIAADRAVEAQRIAVAAAVEAAEERAAAERTAFLHSAVEARRIAVAAAVEAAEERAEEREAAEKEAAEKEAAEKEAAEQRRDGLVAQRDRLIADVNQAEAFCTSEITDASARGVPLSFLNVAKSLLDNADTNADLAAAGEATKRIVDDVYRFYFPSVRRQRP